MWVLHYCEPSLTRCIHKANDPTEYFQVSFLIVPVSCNNCKEWRFPIFDLPYCQNSSQDMLNVSCSTQIKCYTASESITLIFFSLARNCFSYCHFLVI